MSEQSYAPPEKPAGFKSYPDNLRRYADHFDKYRAACDSDMTGAMRRSAEDVEALRAELAALKERMAEAERQEPVASLDGVGHPNNRVILKRVYEKFGIEAGVDQISDALRKIDARPVHAAVPDGLLKTAIECLRACATAMRTFDRPDTAAEVDRVADTIAAAQEGK